MAGRHTSGFKDICSPQSLWNECYYFFNSSKYYWGNRVVDTPPEFVGKQLDTVFTDIYPDAIKIGMVSNEEIIKVIADKLKEYGAKTLY